MPLLFPAPCFPFMQPLFNIAIAITPSGCSLMYYWYSLETHQFLAAQQAATNLCRCEGGGHFPAVAWVQNELYQHLVKPGLYSRRYVTNLTRLPERDVAKRLVLALKIPLTKDLITCPVWIPVPHSPRKSLQLQSRW